MSRNLVIVLLASLCLLGACGKKGTPQPEDKSQSVYPRVYPSQ